MVPQSPTRLSDHRGCLSSEGGFDLQYGEGHPKSLVHQSSLDQRWPYNFLMDMVTELESREKAGSYIQGLGENYQILLTNSYACKRYPSQYKHWFKILKLCTCVEDTGQYSLDFSSFCASRLTLSLAIAA